MTAMSAQSASEIDAPNPFPDLPAIHGPDAALRPPRPCSPTPRRFPRPRFGGYSRTRFESRVAFGGPDDGDGEEADEFIATPTRQFSLLEITSGSPVSSGGRTRFRFTATAFPSTDSGGQLPCANDPHCRFAPPA